ncbi:MAG: hypothetical protein ACI9JM_002473 [Halioglobus sp.]|jgi:hypothetical protein
MKKLTAFTSAAAFALLGACSNDNNNDPQAPVPPASDSRSFEISVVNLTAVQLLSPVGVFLHDSSQQVFSVGTPASVALEIMAEGGDVSALIDAVDSLAEVAGDAPVGPVGNASYTLSVWAESISGLELTVMTMLVNTLWRVPKVYLRKECVVYPSFFGIVFPIFSWPF